MSETVILHEPEYETVAEIVSRGKEQMAVHAAAVCRLFYSSPATLQYNSPGAFGFGVKRAALLMPESVMLLVSPGCCGRISASAGRRDSYADKMYYLTMNETDLVTGRHLTGIAEACREIAETAVPRPKVIMLCITCVDALLGTDMERVCRRAEEAAGIPVLPAYMYAITREGSNPPMVMIRETLYSLLEPGRTDPQAVNLLGNFAPLQDGCELPVLLKQAGYRQVRELSACNTQEEYQKLAEAGLNIVLNPESRSAAEKMRVNLGIGSCELARLYSLQRIRRQYALFGAALGVKLDDEEYYGQAAQAVGRLKAHGTLSFAVGQMVNANPFELALSLAGYGMRVPYVFAGYTAEDFPYLRELSALSPDTRVYSSLDPSMIGFDRTLKNADLAIGEDAGYYLPLARQVDFNSVRQPFGYSGLTELMNRICAALDETEERK